MSKIKHIGKYFILGKQGGRDIMRVSESQLLECLEILEKELAKTIGPLVNYNDVVEYLQEENHHDDN